MSIDTLEAVARDLLDEQTQPKSRPRAWERCHAPVRRVVPEVCPAAWVLPDLLRLIAERHAHPVEELRPSIRQLLADRAFANQTDATAAAAADDAIDAQVDLLIRVLEQVRRHAMACGQWSPMPAAPETFG